MDFITEVVLTGDDAALLDTSISKGDVFTRIDAFDFGAEDGDGGATAVEAAPGSDGVDAVGEAGNDDNSLFSEGFSEVVGDFFAVFAVFAGTDNGDGFDAFFWPFAVIIQ